MGERKVVNKYYSPDFDPAKVPRGQQPKNKQIKVRMMLPMTIRCSTCRDYIYEGTKFNMRKEDAIGERYLGIQIFRFYFNCTNCSAEITIKTDPQNSDYVVESGSMGNVEDEVEGEKEKRKRHLEEMGDAMKCLEKRTLDSKREIDIMAALDEVKSMKSRHAKVSVDAMLEALQRTAPVQQVNLEEEDEALIKSTFQWAKKFVRRIDDEDLDDLMLSTIDESETLEKLKKRKVSQEPSDSPVNRSTNKEDSAGSKAPNSGKFIIKSSSIRVSILKKQTKVSSSKEEKKQEEHQKNDISNGLESLCQQYDNEEDD